MPCKEALLVVRNSIDLPLSQSTALLVPGANYFPEPCVNKCLPPYEVLQITKVNHQITSHQQMGRSSHL